MKVGTAHVHYACQLRDSKSFIFHIGLNEFIDKVYKSFFPSVLDLHLISSFGERMGYCIQNTKNAPAAQMPFIQRNGLFSLAADLSMKL
jgi:hypothetical protein